jgi:GMP synthase-like glutamine amidotransferase
MPWIQSERELILVLMAQNKPIYGACFGAQQISKALGITNISVSSARGSTPSFIYG